MYDGLDYVMRPIEAGMCRMSDALDGTLDLYAFGLMNDYLDVSSENQRRVNKWLADNPKRR